MRRMTAQDLFEWLSALSEEERRNCRLLLEGDGDTAPCVTAEVYDEDRDGKVDTVYLIYK